MEAILLIFVAAVVLLIPPVLAGLTLRQFRKAGGKPGWRVAVPTAVLADWILLLLWFVAETREFGRNQLSTPRADFLLLLSLVLLIGSAVISVGRWKLCAATLVLVCLWVWTEQLFALRDDGSMLSVLISTVADNIGCPPGNSTFTVLHQMANYEKRGRYDAAIRIGSAWTEKHPQDGANDRLFIAMASMLLQKARHDRAHADDYVRQALQYRDKAIPIASDTSLGWYSMAAVRDLAIITESAGDLSPGQRCIQYGNTIKLLERFDGLLKDKQDEIARRFVTDKEDLTAADVKCLSDETQAKVVRVREKQRSSGCE